MPDQDRGSYFVRLDDRPRSGGSPTDLPEGQPHHRHRRRRIRPLYVLLFVLAGWFLWASTTEGGSSARMNDMIEKVREVLFDATTDPGLKRAATYYNSTYEREHAYPRLGEEEKTDAGVGVGVNVVWCNANAIVLQGLTGSGSTSRLLLNGQDFGDVHAKVGCPADFANPEPWGVP
ncbi:MAG: hypothetical protein SGJ13_06145 [Actinomycetota bacterium]|nr:hypothetical protein [Actinomycetota bacterium]